MCHTGDSGILVVDEGFDSRNLGAASMVSAIGARSYLNAGTYCAHAVVPSGAPIII
jgi:hypothetical protein